MLIMSLVPKNLVELAFALCLMLSSKHAVRIWGRSGDLEAFLIKCGL